MGNAGGMYWNLSSSRASFASPLLLMHDIPKPQTTELLIKAMNVARVLTSCRILQDKPFWWVVHGSESPLGGPTPLWGSWTKSSGQLRVITMSHGPPPLAQTRWNYVKPWYYGLIFFKHKKATHLYSYCLTQNNWVKCWMFPLGPGQCTLTQSLTQTSHQFVIPRK